MKKRLIMIIMAMGLAFSIPVAAEEDLAARVTALEARVAQLEQIIAEFTAEEDTEVLAELPEGMQALESYVIEIGIGTVLRDTPDEKGKIVKKLRVGDKVTVMAGSEEWLQVQFNDELGYVNRALAEGN